MRFDTKKRIVNDIPNSLKILVENKEDLARNKNKLAVSNKPLLNIDFLIGQDNLKEFFELSLPKRKISSGVTK